jgi:PHD/YefM family antitoxin component YafN of YafNO toxin-antitoxin module
MASSEIQFVTNERGEETAVILPIELWREITSERETSYLLKSPARRQRLTEALQRTDGVSLEAALEKLGI